MIGRGAVWMTRDQIRYLRRIGVQFSDDMDVYALEEDGTWSKL